MVSAALILASAQVGVIGVCWEGDMPLTEAMRNDYEKMFASVVIPPDRKKEVDQIIARMIAGRTHYDKVSAATSVPWFVIAVIHDMECANRFDCHLHNGDPLTHRTVQEPKGRPPNGQPPFAWETSAIDALRYEGFDVWTEWTVPGTLFKLELYNGAGYKSHGVTDPYLWGGSQFYKQGKYIADHVFNPNAVSDQIGAAVLLRSMHDTGYIELPLATIAVAEAQADTKCDGMNY